MSLSTDIAELARVEIKKVLGPHFLGYEYKGKDDHQVLDEVTNELLNNLSRFLQTGPVSSKKLGATVMTESASMRSGKNGLPAIPPRSL